MDAEKMEYLEMDKVVQEMAMKAAETADRFIFETVLPFCQENYQGELKKEDLSRALGLLKAQEPRVMTLDEVKKLPAETDVWIQHAGKFADDVIRAATVSEVTNASISFWFGGSLYYMNYGEKPYGWICWTSRPTEEQRKAIAWK